ncbi:MAG: T9SS type A sorting domain-containing protein [Crocinitomicaceae bacterium]
MSLYPNPNNGDFNVLIRTASTEGQLGTLDIINFNGAIIHSAALDIHSGFNLFPVQESLSPGMYFFRFIADNQNEQRIKFVVR